MMDIIPVEDFDPRDYLEGRAVTNCPSGKHRYPTPAKARAALKLIRRSGARLAQPDGSAPKKPVRSYPCGRCGGYHLTSDPR